MESSPTPTPPTERTSPQPEQQPQPQPQQPSAPSPNAQADIQAQEEYLRALLRSQQPEPNQPPAGAEDPTAKLLSALLGGEVPPGVTGGAGGAGGAPGPGQGPGASQNPLGDLTAATGLPPFVTDMLTGQSSAPKTASELRNEQILKFLHALFSVLVGVYLLALIRSSALLYGEGSTPPPPPSTAQNPFTVFVMGELLLLGGARVLGTGKSNGGGGKLARAMGGFQLVRGIVRDGGIAVFVIGAGTWWLGRSQG